MFRATIPAPRTRSGRLTAPRSPSTPQPARASTSSPVSQGTHPAPLPLSVGAFNGDPAYSRDGTQISFDQDTGPAAPRVHGIFIANADGSDARRVTTGIRTTKAYDTESQWSPDGKRLAFMRVKNGKQAAVFVVNVDGTGLKRLTPWSLDAASPDWSPDGREILFNTYYDHAPRQVLERLLDEARRQSPNAAHARTPRSAVIPTRMVTRRHQNRLRPLHAHRQEQRPDRSVHDEPPTDGAAPSHQHAAGRPCQPRLGTAP